MQPALSTEQLKGLLAEYPGSETEWAAFKLWVNVQRIHLFGFGERDMPGLARLNEILEQAVRQNSTKNAQQQGPKDRGRDA